MCAKGRKHLYKSDTFLRIKGKNKLLSTSSPSPSKKPTFSSECTTTLVDNLLSYTSTLVSSSSKNLVAFSGGVDSSLVASLVYQTTSNITTNSSSNAEAVAVMGVSNSLPPEQRKLAIDIANNIGITLHEVKTNEGDDLTYVENKGQSCYICKTHLYSSISAITRHASSMLSSSQQEGNVLVLFNGTNKDDMSDPTRVGLLAAQEFKVQSPLIHITKEQVRQASKHIGLPNWNYAASPCLRSRLAFGVKATSQHLLNVSKAEQYIRTKLSLPHDINFRVRVLAKKRVRVELDSIILNSEHYMEILNNDDVKEYFMNELGFTGGIVDIREFKSGSVAATATKPLDLSSSSLNSDIIITETKYADAA